MYQIYHSGLHYMIHLGHLVRLVRHLSNLTSPIGWLSFCQYFASKFWQIISHAFSLLSHTPLLSEVQKMPKTHIKYRRHVHERVAAN